MRRINNVRRVVSEIKTRFLFGEFQIIAVSDESATLILSSVPAISNIISSDIVYAVFPIDAKRLKMMITKI